MYEPYIILHQHLHHGVCSAFVSNIDTSEETETTGGPAVMHVPLLQENKEGPRWGTGREKRGKVTFSSLVDRLHHIIPQTHVMPGAAVNRPINHFRHPDCLSLSLPAHKVHTSQHSIRIYVASRTVRRCVNRDNDDIRPRSKRGPFFGEGICRARGKGRGSMSKEIARTFIHHSPYLRGGP